MRQPAYITFRVEQDLKKAVEDAAKADSRNTTSLLTKLIKDHLQEQQLLKKKRA
jgi:predicted transcriptional regulator